ncbi:hypothetical protein ACOSP7_032511 [Xanthoceras sorbifolium]
MHAPSLVDVQPIISNPGMVFHASSIISSPNRAQRAVVNQSEGVQCISSSPKHPLVTVMAQDKGKGVVFSAKNDRAIILPIDMISATCKLS